jgi:ribosome-associated heat shock protein Hsp15
MRIDKYLWAMRIFKTRNDAADACKSGKVSVNGTDAKPSREVKIGETVIVQRAPVAYTYKVIALIDQRQSAKNVPLFLENLTSPEELEKKHVVPFIQRESGTGRPTKKERRDLDELYEQCF